METIPPDKEGCSDLQSELGFALAPRETDPTHVVTRTFERGKSRSRGTDLRYGQVTRTGRPRNKRNSGNTVRTGNRNATGTGNIGFHANNL